MARSFRLPDLGEGIHEGEVIAVRVAVGQSVSEGDPILEIETDKAAVEIPSPYTGVVEEIRVKPGDVVNVGDVLIIFSGAEKATREEKPAGPAPAAAASPAERPASASDRPVPASPATRRMARELGVDLRRVSPSGPAGRVTAEDVRRFAKDGADIAGDRRQPAPELSADLPADAAPAGLPGPDPDATLPDFTRWGEVRRVPFRSIRRATARRMALAWSRIPHVTSQDVIDVTELEAFRQRHKGEMEKAGGWLTLTVFALKAAATAIKKFPNFNSTLDTAAGELILKDYIHIGVATDTEDGLIVPVIRDVDRKSITDLAVELADLIDRTRKRKVSPEEMQGGTFTITNIGAHGGGHFTPIINDPQVAIMGMGAARMEPVVRDDRRGGYRIVPRLILPVVMAIDHRVLDGADSVRFLQTVRRLLEDPDAMLMAMV